MPVCFGPLAEGNGAVHIAEDGTFVHLCRNLLAGGAVEDAVYMMTKVPSEIMGIDSFKGKLKAGYDADIVVFDDDITIEKVISCKNN